MSRIVWVSVLAVGLVGVVRLGLALDDWAERKPLGVRLAVAAGLVALVAIGAIIVIQLRCKLGWLNPAECLT